MHNFSPWHPQRQRKRESKEELPAGQVALLQERRRSVAVIKERSEVLEHAMSILQQGIHASMQKVRGKTSRDEEPPRR